MKQDIIDLLLASDLFGKVPRDTLSAITPGPEWVHLETGKTLIEQGETGNSYYYLIQGRLQVSVAGDGGEIQTVGYVWPGEGVGEMSLLTDEPTSATVRGMYHSDLITFSRASFLHLMESSPSAALEITRQVINRLQVGYKRQEHKLPYAAITVLPIDPGVDAARFASLLVEHLEPYASASTVTPADLDPELAALTRKKNRLSPDDAFAVVSKFTEFQQKSDIVIYQAAIEDTQWMRLSMRQSELILLVATVDGNPELAECEHAILEGVDEHLMPQADLVLLHPEDFQPRCGTKRWIDRRTVNQFHHLRQWAADDFARLARVVTGNAVGLVLSGGGARGLSQIGTLKALKEAGVPIDRVGGTSMGALVGAQYALGQTIDEIIQTNRQVWVEGNPMSDYTFPAMSMIRGRRLQNLAKEIFKDWEIENLPIPFFCVSTNLTDAELKLHDRGTLWKGIRASCSIPGVGPPMFHDGKILVDGGVLNNLPGDIFSEKYGGILIIVDVAPEEPIVAPENVEDTISGWRILLSRFNPLTKPIPAPSMFQILYQISTLNSNRAARRTYSRADLLLLPPLETFGTLDFAAIDEIITIGYGEAVRRLRNLKDGRLLPIVSLDELPRTEDLPEAEDIVIRLARQRKQRRVVHRLVGAAAVFVIVFAIGFLFF